MGDLAAGMHAGIGAPRCGKIDSFAGEGEDSILDRLLDRGSVVLALPADIAGAIIFHEQAKSRHGSTVPMAR